MADAPPLREADRLLALRAMNILDTAEEESFDRLTRVAAALFDAPIVVVSLVDGDRLWFKSRVGLDASECPIEGSFCACTIGTDQPLVVPDALADDRFRNNPLVTGPERVRFYAGAQLRTRDNHDLGTFSILDRQPGRTMSERDLALLSDLADTATLLMEQRRLVLEYEAHVVARRAAEQQSRLAKDEAEDATAAMRALFSRVSHDLRTPLAAISGFSELLADSPLTAEQQSDLEEVRRAARDLLNMIDSLLQVTSAEDTDSSPQG